MIGADGTIYVASNAGVLHAINPLTGQDRWTYDAHTTDTGADLSISPLVLPDRTILYPTPGSNDLIALSPAGHLLWEQQLPGQPTSPVTVDGTRVYVGDESGAVTALDVRSGLSHQLAWTLHVGSESFASAVANGAGRVYVTTGSALVAIQDHGTSASIAWRADPHDGAVEVSAGLAADGTVLLGTNGGYEWAYRPDGTLFWRSPRAKTYSSPAVTASGLIYSADNTGRVVVFDLGTGAERGAYRAASTNVWTSTVVDKDYRVYFAGQNGHVYGVSPSGTLLFDLNAGAPADSYPALTADGALIIGTAAGSLLAIG